MTEFYLVRHGETDWNLQGRLQGHTDIPLNATGISQAEQLREVLAHVPFAAAFSSDLSRAFHTAELILQSHNLSLTTSSLLRERSAGQLEGQKTNQFDEVIQSFLEKALDKHNYMHSAWHSELETMHSTLERVLSFLFMQAQQFCEQTILVVTHGGVLRSILDHCSFTPKKRWIVNNCGFIKIKIDQPHLHLLEYQGVKLQEINYTQTT